MDLNLIKKGMVAWLLGIVASIPAIIVGVLMTFLTTLMLPILRSENLCLLLVIVSYFLTFFYSYAYLLKKTGILRR